MYFLITRCSYILLSTVFSDGVTSYHSILYGARFNCVTKIVFSDGVTSYQSVLYGARFNRLNCVTKIVLEIISIKVNKNVVVRMCESYVL